MKFSQCFLVSQRDQHPRTWRCESKVVLEGSAVVQDADGRVAGHRITLLQGQRRAIVEGGGPAGARARITLPAISSQ